MAIRYQYPEHLREIAESIPAAPGVYIFHGDDEHLPLYIGKSINLRDRVFSHLRNRREARMLRQTRRVSHHRTAGNIGALLLESRLVKERYPLLNRQLRRNFRLCSLKLRTRRPVTRSSASPNTSSTTWLSSIVIFGFFSTRSFITRDARNSSRR